MFDPSIPDGQVLPRPGDPRPDAAARAYKIDFAPDGTVTRWHLAPEGAVPTEDADYHPTIYVAGPDGPLAALRDRLDADPKVLGTATVERRRDLHAPAPEPVLEVRVERIGDVDPLAREVRGVHEPALAAPGDLRCFDVDLSPQFRYCLDEDVDPFPPRALTTLELAMGEKALADGEVAALTVDDERVGATAVETLRALAGRLAREDPDVLVVSHGALVPLLADTAAEAGVSMPDGGPFRLGRRPGYRTLAGANTFESYGQVGFSPARYDVPGRALIDGSNSFLWHKTALDGIRYFVHRAGRPVQEVAWGSIGTILTAMQTRAARERGVLVPWNKWEPESFKSVDTLHGADRGGVTFSPEVGLHEDVEEVDFASLYPNIMIERNVSPETVDCACHPERADVPELGYGICPEDGFVPAVLEPMVDDRQAIKAVLAGATGARREALANTAEAIKWILVSCFGYQGYRNAKFGRIEAHEAINAYAREILLDAKATAEAGGWALVHGIVDSVWLTRREPDATPVEALCERITDDVGIDLEHEHTFDWVCFVPRRGERAGALTRYFGKLAGRSGDDPEDYKLRGIECRQHSTPTFVVEAQLDLIRALDRAREPAPVVDRLAGHRRRLAAGDVPASELLIAKRATKPAGAYTRDTHVAGALRRAARRGLAYSPGQTVRYVVTDDDARRPEHGVRLHFEEPSTYDPAFYDRELVRAAESVVSPLGWTREDVRAHLRDAVDADLAAYG
ncbi:MAG: type B DNA-directed DNA polymerase [Halobacteriales archaeon]|nr:type B DNA-directed DNA polymerase [Halobacteriales archaeon]